MSTPDFIDECRVMVRAGAGGRGCCSFRREKFVPRGGPDGGNGGDGGSVLFEAGPGMTTLLDSHHRKHYSAGRGAHGKGARKNGRAGEDLCVKLPLGTVVKNDTTGEVLHEILEVGDRWIAARGGRGGRGNSCFATSTNRAPQRAEAGEPGEQRWLRLELKVLADVGLLGFPNAGKSTLVSRVSAARPQIASFPFTTLQPHLGMVELGDRRFVIADIPGLIPGAHQGAGLGNRFLRHLERTRILVHLIDPEPGLRGEANRSPETDYAVLRRELAAHSRGLAERPEQVCLAKSDLVPDPADRRRIVRGLQEQGLEPRWISSATGEGIPQLLEDLAQKMETR
jgi:GTP-binding protein